MLSDPSRARRLGQQRFADRICIRTQAGRPTRVWLENQVVRASFMPDSVAGWVPAQGTAMLLRFYRAR